MPFSFASRPCRDWTDFEVANKFNIDFPDTCLLKRRRSFLHVKRQKEVKSTPNKYNLHKKLGRRLATNYS